MSTEDGWNLSPDLKRLCCDLTTGALYLCYISAFDDKQTWPNVYNKCMCLKSIPEFPVLLLHLFFKFKFISTCIIYFLCSFLFHVKLLFTLNLVLFLEHCKHLILSIRFRSRECSFKEGSVFIHP